MDVHGCLWDVEARPAMWTVMYLSGVGSDIAISPYEILNAPDIVALAPSDCRKATAPRSICRIKLLLVSDDLFHSGRSKERGSGTGRGKDKGGGEGKGRDRGKGGGRCGVVSSGS